MWANVFLSKYSHSRVTTFKLHLKHNNDFTKLIFDEEHLPKHMRLRFPMRLIRYLFIPICFIACACLMHHSGIYKQIDDYCHRREECYAHCISSNFPHKDCKLMELDLQFQGNEYNRFFFFPKPDDSAS